MNTYPIDNPVFFDLEVYPGWFLAGFKLPDGSYRSFASSDNTNVALDILDFLRWVKDNNLPLVGFNSLSYDDLVLTALFRSGGDVNAAHLRSRTIIETDTPRWTFEDDINSVDLMPVLPGRMSLKRLGVCLGHRRLQELPVDPHHYPSPEEQQTLLAYNLNDLDITEKLYWQLYPDLALRRELSIAHGTDLRSKGEATLAEQIILRDAGAVENRKQLNSAGFSFVDADPTVRIFRPSWWHSLVKDQILLGIGEGLFNTPVRLRHDGRLDGQALSRIVYAEDRYYQMGVGGLHSIDGPGAWVPTDDEVLLDLDVASYYPNLILTQGLYPRQWGDTFLSVYKGIVDQRMAAKRSGDTSTAQILKIAANGVFGKSSDPYSSLYDPQLTINVTVLGQLGLLALIFSLQGVARVCSANTDGVTILVPRARLQDLDGIAGAWQSATGLELERTEYRALYQKDVNNYIAVKKAGGIKAKGRFVDLWPNLRGMPNANIVATALQKFAEDGTPIEETIFECRDINQFILTQNVAKGWVTTWGDRKLGNVLRFYKSNSQDATSITRTPVAEGIKGSAGTVPNSESCVPVEDLPEVFPRDISYSWYINEALSLWRTISRPKRPGLNKWADLLSRRGYRPCPVDPSGVYSRARVTYGAEDFTSLPEGWVIGTGTGDGLLGLQEEHRTLVYSVDVPYPSRTRARVQAEHGFTLYYGARVPLLGIPRGVLRSEGQGDLWDQYYTDAELRKVKNV